MQRATTRFCFLLILIFASCSSLKESALKGNPDFAANAEKYLITSPIPSTTSKRQIYELEDSQTGTVYAVEVKVQEPGTRDERESPAVPGDVILTKEFEGHRLFINNAMDKKSYEIIGKTSLVRATEKLSAKVTEETTMINYPIEFWIFEDGKDVGKLVVLRPSLTAQRMEIALHERRMELEFQDQFNKHYYSFKSGGELIAFIEMKPKGFVATSMKGEASLKPGLSPDQKSDLFACFVVAGIVMKIIHEVS